jgi:hypothetical protein
MNIRIIKQSIFLKGIHALNVMPTVYLKRNLDTISYTYLIFNKRSVQNNNKFLHCYMTINYFHTSNTNKFDVILRGLDHIPRKERNYTLLRRHAFLKTQIVT